jgi:hypothetical protein
MQIKFQNHEIRQGLMISYVKLVINYIECFEQVIMDGVYKSKYLDRSFRVSKAS